MLAYIIVYCLILSCVVTYFRSQKSQERDKAWFRGSQRLNALPVHLLRQVYKIGVLPRTSFKNGDTSEYSTIGYHPLKMRFVSTKRWWSSFRVLEISSSQNRDHPLRKHPYHEFSCFLCFHWQASVPIQAFFFWNPGYHHFVTPLSRFLLLKLNRKHPSHTL